MINFFSKLFSEQSRSITHAAVIIAAASFVSRLLGVIRDRVLASEFGVGKELDIYYAAFRIPDTIYVLVIVGALSAGFVPLFTELLGISKERAWKFANHVLSWVMLNLAIICVALFIFAKPLMRILTPGFTPDMIDQAVVMTRIMLGSTVLFGVSSVFSGILQSFKRFALYSLAPILYNVGIIFSAFVFVPIMGVMGLAWGVVLGAFLHMAVQFPTSKFLGFSFAPFLSYRDQDFRSLVSLMVPRTLGVVLLQVNTIIMTALATLLASGSLSVYTLANNIVQFPVNVFGLSLAVAAFPILCDLTKPTSRDEFITSFSSTLRQILFFVIPITALFIILRAQIVRVILGGGVFDWNATITTAYAVAIFSLSLFSQALIPLFIRAFFALKDTVTPLVSSVIMVAINAGLAFVFTRGLAIGNITIDSGVAGLAWATVIASIIQLGILWISLRAKIGTLREVEIFFSVGKLLLATVAMGVTTQAVKYLIEPFVGTRTFFGIFSQGLVAGLCGIAVFVIIGFILQIPELLSFIDSLKRRFKFTQVSSEKEGLESGI